jgi:hypothetical protein
LEEEASRNVRTNLNMFKGLAAVVRSVFVSKKEKTKWHDANASGANVFHPKERVALQITAARSRRLSPSCPSVFRSTDPRPAAF